MRRQPFNFSTRAAQVLTAVLCSVLGLLNKRRRWRWAKMTRRTNGHLSR